jgi:hypothetical protein
MITILKFSFSPVSTTRREPRAECYISEAVVERFAFASNLLTTAGVWGSGLRCLALHSVRSVAL